MVIIMKNILSAYYQIIIDDKNLKENECFSYNNHLFCLYKYKRNIDEIKSLIDLNKYLLNNNIRMNEIIINIYNEALTYYDNMYYILIKINYRFNNMNFKFIEAPLNKNFEILKRNNWGYLWSSKIDYIEYQISHFQNKYPILIDSVNYYIGLAENAIMYFNMLKLDNVPLYINHRRVREIDLYNPTELVIDYKVRDICGYLKRMFFTKKMTIYDIKKYILSLNLQNIDYILLYTRMLFPSYYFDIYDRIINEEIKEEAILEITNRYLEYEELLYEIYLIIKRKINNIIGIEWINQKYIV